MVSQTRHTRRDKVAYPRAHEQTWCKDETTNFNGLAPLTDHHAEKGKRTLSRTTNSVSVDRYGLTQDSRSPSRSRGGTSEGSPMTREFKKYRVRVMTRVESAEKATEQLAAEISKGGHERISQDRGRETAPHT